MKTCLICGHRFFGVEPKDSKACMVCLMSLPAAVLDTELTRAVRQMADENEPPKL